MGKTDLWESLSYPNIYAASCLRDGIYWGYILCYLSALQLPTRWQWKACHIRNTTGERSKGGCNHLMCWKLNLMYPRGHSHEAKYIRERFKDSFVKSGIVSWYKRKATFTIQRIFLIFQSCNGDQPHSNSSLANTISLYCRWVQVLQAFV